MLEKLHNLKKCLEHSLIVGTKFINDDYKLKKAIEDFGELEKINPIFERIKNLSDLVFTSKDTNDVILGLLWVVNAVYYTQGKNEIENKNEYKEMKFQKRCFENTSYKSFLFLKTLNNEKIFTNYVLKNPSFLETQSF